MEARRSALRIPCTLSNNVLTNLDSPQSPPEITSATVTLDYGRQSLLFYLCCRHSQRIREPRGGFSGRHRLFDVSALPTLTLKSLLMLRKRLRHHLYPDLSILPLPPVQVRPCVPQILGTSFDAAELSLLRRTYTTCPGVYPLVGCLSFVDAQLQRGG